MLIGLPFLAVVLGIYRGGQFSQFLLLGAVAAALALTWGIAGVLNLGQSITFGVGVYAGAWFGLHWGGAGTVAGVVCGAVLGGVTAWVIATVTLRRRLDVITVALTTFVLALAAEDIANQWQSVTGGEDGLNGVPGIHLGGLLLSAAEQRAAAAAVAVIAVLGFAALARRPYGAALAACRDDERRMASLGYDVLRLKVGVFTVTGAAVGLLGAVYATQVQYASTTFLGVTFATDFVIWALLGSRRTIWGPLVATVLYNVGVVELTGSALNYWLLITGIVFVAFVLFVPEGGAVAFQKIVPASWQPRTSVALGVAAEPTSERTGSLVASEITCRFGSVRAVSEVSLTLSSPGIHCVIGPNGAGKSTLLDVLSGTTPAASGSWWLGDTDVTGSTPWVIARAGLGRKFQSPCVATSLTVAENLALARWGKSHGPLALARQRWEVSLPPEVWSVLGAADLVERTSSVAGDLSHGQRQILELAMTLAAGCDLLLLDEPTAGMSANETGRLAELLLHLSRERKLPLLVVEHDIAFIRSVADEVTVMRNGSIMMSGTVAEVEGDERVKDVYLGRSALLEP